MTIPLNGTDKTTIITETRNHYTSIHPTQKPVKLLKKLIEIFTDDGDVVIDPCAGSGSTLIASLELNRKPYGFEIKKDFFNSSTEWIKEHNTKITEIKEVGFAKTAIGENLFSEL